MRLRIHHRNLLALTPEEKRELYPSFEAQLMPLVDHITSLRRLPEFKGVKYLADLLFKPKMFCYYSEEQTVPSKLSAVGAKRGVRSVPMRTVPSQRPTLAQPAEGRLWA